MCIKHIILIYINIFWWVTDKKRILATVTKALRLCASPGTYQEHLQKQNQTAKVKQIP